MLSHPGEHLMFFINRVSAMVKARLRWMPDQCG